MVQSRVFIMLVALVLSCSLWTSNAFLLTLLPAITNAPRPVNPSMAMATPSVPRKTKNPPKEVVRRSPKLILVGKDEEDLLALLDGHC